MPPELALQLMHVVSGTAFLGLGLGSFWQIWSFRRPDGPMERGLALKTEPLSPRTAAGLRTIEGREVYPWGWTRREGDLLRVFVDPYYKGDGHMRIETPWPHVAVVRFTDDGAEVRYRTPTLPLVLLGLPFLFVIPYLSHRALVARIRERLEQLAQLG